MKLKVEDGLVFVSKKLSAISKVPDDLDNLKKHFNQTGYEVLVKAVQ